MAGAWRIKICGVTLPADGLLAAQLGADAIGLNFWRRSPRYVDFATAREIGAVLPAWIGLIAVTVNPSCDDLARLCDQVPRVDAIQIYRDRWDVQARISLPWIAAFAARDRQALDEFGVILGKNHRSPPSAVLADAHVPGQYGGTGQEASWQIWKEWELDVPLILAGGLTPGNVATAIRSVRPHGVDVAGGVESSPGRKDADKMRRYIEAARLAFEETASQGIGNKTG